MPLSGASRASPRVLFVYFTYTQQSHKVAEAMAGFSAPVAAWFDWRAST